MDSRADAFAALPRIDALVADARELVERYGQETVTAALRTAVATARTAIAAGAPPPAPDALIADATAALAVTRPGPPTPVINATGVIVHTNLGRAPLSAEAIAAMVDAAGYCDVEYDRGTGRRGSRSNRLQPVLGSLTGAEAAIAVNNGAAALVLALAAVAGGRQVVVSRGELVEIGGSFRLPEVMGAAGVRLLEVGTTNRTRADDYRAGDDVALLLKVHPSNYRLTGFVAAPTVAELAPIASERDVPLLHDIGSGLLQPSRITALRDEPDAATALADGADLVVCSGDKLLGGPQAGLLLGRADLVRRCAKHPLARALRLDKIRLAALVATLETHARGAAGTELPVWRAMTADGNELRQRSAALATVTGGVVVDGTTMIGGGSTPEEGLRGPVVRIETAGAERAARALRTGDPAVVVRVADGGLLVDLRTVAPADDEVVRQRLAAVLA